MTPLTCRVDEDDDNEGSNVGGAAGPVGVMLRLSLQKRDNNTLLLTLLEWKSDKLLFMHLLTWSYLTWQLTPVVTSGAVETAAVT